MSIDTPARIAILGAGPIGIEAALYARFLGYDVDVFEAGAVGDSLSQWPDVVMQTSFGENSSPLGRSALAAQDSNWQSPDLDAKLTCGEYLERYLHPLAQCDLLADSIHVGGEVLGVGRVGMAKGDLAGSDARINSEFRLQVNDPEAEGLFDFTEHLADAVIDCTGVQLPLMMFGEGGLSALGESTCYQFVDHGVAEVLGIDRDRFAHKHTLVVGDTFEAAILVTHLDRLAREAPYTRVTWLLPHAHGERPLADYVRAAYDEAQRLVAAGDGHLTQLRDTYITEIDCPGEDEPFRVRFRGAVDGEQTFDRLINAIGSRPTWSLVSELHFAPSPFDDGLPQGEYAADDPRRLLTPEPDFYVLGAKSFGRRQDFTIAAGLRQIRDLFTIIGDRADLDLYRGR